MTTLFSHGSRTATWTLMTHSPDNPEQLARQARDWVLRLASGQAGADDLEAFARWRAQGPQWQQAFERERALWQAMGQVEQEVRALAAESAVEVEVGRQTFAPAGNGVAGGRTIGRTRRRHQRWSVVATATAAIVGLALVLPGQSWRWQADHRAGYAVEQVRLEDGSQAVLDAGAAIRVSYDDTRRTVQLLRGRAWFRVAHGDARPFQVEAGSGVTRDIGTAFEVALLPSQVSAAVSEGEVEVRAGGSRLRLRAGQSAAYRQGGAVEQGASLPAAAVAAWREGDIVVERQPAAAAIAEIARYYPGRVLMLGELESAPVSGVFRSERAEAGIRSIAAMAGARVWQLPGGWLLVRPGAAT